MADKIGMMDSIDGSAILANKGQTVEIYHIPSKYSVIFKAMMTQFDDAYTSNWTSEQAYGRMDPLQTYQNTSRVISMGFDVAAASYDEAAVNMEKVSSFAQFLYPVYDAHGLISSSPFCKIQFMNWSTDAGGSTYNSRASQTGLMGTINGFTFAPDLDVGVFDDAFGGLYPKKLNVSFSFTVLHNHALGWRAAPGEDPVEPRERIFPYLSPPANNSEDADDAPFESVISEIQEAEVPNESQAAAIRRRLVEGFERAFDASQVQRRNNRTLRRGRDAAANARSPGIDPQILGGGGGTLR